MDRKLAAEALIFAFVIVVVLWSLRPRRRGHRGGSDASYAYGTGDGAAADNCAGPDGGGGCGGGDGGGGGGD